MAVLYQRYNIASPSALPPTNELDDTTQIAHFRGISGIAPTYISRRSPRHFNRVPLRNTGGLSYPGRHLVPDRSWADTGVFDNLNYKKWLKMPFTSAIWYAETLNHDPRVSSRYYEMSNSGLSWNARHVNHFAYVDVSTKLIQFNSVQWLFIWQRVRYENVNKPMKWTTSLSSNCKLMICNRKCTLPRSLMR